MKWRKREGFLDSNLINSNSYVESLLPAGFTRVDSFSTNASYEFLPSEGLIPRLFKQINANKDQHGIEDWALSQTTLEEVFLRIIHDADAEAE